MKKQSPIEKAYEQERVRYDKASQCEFMINSCDAEIDRIITNKPNCASQRPISIGLGCGTMPEAEQAAIDAAVRVLQRERHKHMIEFVAVMRGNKRKK